MKGFRSNYANWGEEKVLALSEGKDFKKSPPTLQIAHKEFPVFYRGNMFKRIDEKNAAIKVFKNNDWVWVDITFKGQDLYKRNVWDWKESNTKITRVGKKYFINFTYELIS